MPAARQQAASSSAFGTHQPYPAWSVRLAVNHSGATWNAYGSYRIPSRTA
jgi:hypothetical protein